MITKVNDLDKVIPILEANFKGYVVSNDPFEKVAVYTDSDIIGLISYSIIYERSEINYIVTTADYRKQGIGSKLLEYALDDMRSSGCKEVSLEVEITNKPAFNMYLKYGFEIKSTREKYYDNNDAYLMTRKLR